MTRARSLWTTCSRDCFSRRRRARVLGRLGLLVLVVAFAGCSDDDTLGVDREAAGWPVYGGDPGGQRFSPLGELTPENVDQLEVAWTYHTGDMIESKGLSDDALDAAPPATSFESTPILVDDALVFCTPFDRVIALDAETGAERWTFDPEIDREGHFMLTCRGVSAWTDSRAEATEACRTRIFSGTLDGRLIALDARTGRLCEGFGDHGTVDLKRGVGDPRPGEYGVTSPPAILGDRVITGSMVLDNRRVDAPSGVVRAYSARTGKQLWAWNALPPGEATKQQGAYRRGTANAWSVFSVDPERNLVFVPTGNAAPDYFGGLRAGLDFYSSSIVALDGDSGEPVWHFQTVHHDLWDYDVPAQPVLFDFPTAGGRTPGVIAATKMGHLFFLDRSTGRPLLPIEERRVPGRAAPGEVGLSPTQPFPIKPPPLHPASLRPEDAFGYTPWDRSACRKIIESARSDGIFTPPSTQGTIEYPGMAGGVNWGSLSVDAGRRLLVVNTQRVATYVRLVPRSEYDAMVEKLGGAPRFGFEPQLGTPYALERRPLVSPWSGTPCNPPPWGTLAAVDLATGDIAWEVPLGSTRDLAPWPIWMMLGEVGVPNLGGPITTASGLTFIGATTDATLRAFKTATGEELWRARLPASAQATPMTYRVRPGGKQYVVVAAGGHMLLGTAPGDALVAFALP